jgi:hypothetical protein
MLPDPSARPLFRPFARRKPWADRVRPAVPKAKIAAYEQMRKWHAAHVVGVGRMTSDTEAGQLEDILRRVEWSWAALWTEHHDAEFEQARLMADLPMTPSQRDAVERLEGSRLELAQRAEALADIGRGLPARVAALAGSHGTFRIDPVGLRMAFVEAQFGIEELSS